MRGYTGPGGKKQVADLVHKGGVVFSQDDGQRLGGVSAVEAVHRGSAIAASISRLQVPANSNGGAGGVDINVNVAGATGCQEVLEMVCQSVSQGSLPSPAFTSSTRKELAPHAG